MIIKIIRYLFATICLALSLMWIFLTTPQGSSYAKKFLEQEMEKATGWHVEIGSIHTLPPFWIRVHDLCLTPKDPKEAKLCTEVFTEALDIVPLLFDLPFRSLTLLYCGVHDIQITLPAPAQEPLAEQILHRFSSPASLTIESHSITSDDRFAGLFDHLPDLNSFFSRLPCSVRLMWSHFSLKSVEIEKEGFFKELVSPCDITTSFVHADPKEYTVSGSISCTPKSPSLGSILSYVSATVSIQSDPSSSKNIRANIKGAIKTQDIRSTLPYLEESHIYRRKISFAGDLKLTDPDTISGTWSLSVPKTFDRVLGDRYIASYIKAQGMCGISRDGTVDLFIKKAKLKGGVFAANLPGEDGVIANGVAVRPNELSLASYAETPLWMSSLIFRSASIRFYYPEKSPSLSERDLYVWQVDHALPHIVVKSLKSRANRSHSIKRVTCRLMAEGSLYQNQWENPLESSPHLKKFGIVSRIDRLSDKGRRKTPFATLEGSITSQANISSGSIALSSQFFRGKVELKPPFSSERHCDISLELPSLSVFQSLTPEKLEGALSCLITFSSSVNASPSTNFLPSPWQFENILCSGSDIVFGENLYIGSLAASLADEAYNDAYIGTHVIRKARLGSQHWVEISKSAIRYDRRTGMFTVHDAYQKGSEHMTPYALSTKGVLGRTILYNDLGSMIQGELTTTGHFGNDELASQATLSIPTSLDGTIKGLGSLALTGTLGEKGTFALDIIARDWRGRKMIARGSCEHIPSHIATSLISLPHANGDFSASFHALTKNRSVQALYNFHGTFSWLDRMVGDNLLIVKSSGTINSSQGNITLSLDSGATEEPLTCALSFPVVQNMGSFPFIRIPRDSPITGDIQGQCELQSLVSPWMEEEEWVEGLITVSSKITGSFDNSSLQGELSLSGGKLDILALGGVLSDITIHGSLYGKELYIDDLRATDDKKGALKGTGVLLLPIANTRPFSWRANLNCSQVEIVNLSYAQAIVSGNVNLSGTTDHILIEGQVESDEATIDVSKRFTIPYPELPIVYDNTPEEKKEQKASFSFLLNLDVHTKNPLEIKGRGLSSTWKGHAVVTGPTAKPRIEGDFSTIQGSFAFAGKDFDISQGSVSFDGDLIQQSRLSLTASAELPHLTTRVLLRGTLDNPKISLESNPIKTEKEILSLILFNKELGDISPLESLQLASTAMSLDQSAAPMKFLDSIKKTLGIDIIDISSSKDTTNNDVSLRVGKYLSQGVNVSVSKDITTETNRIGVEVEVAKNISAEAEISDDSQAVVSIKWKKDF